MTSVQEAFVIALGRASERATRKLRGLQRADRDDILSTAILWCWENRATYNVKVPLEVWIMGAVRHAYQQWGRGEARTVTDLQENIPVPDDTLARAEVQSSLDELIRSLSPEEREIVRLRVDGLSRSEIRDQLSVSAWTIKETFKKLRSLRTLIPEPSELKHALRRKKTPSSDHTINYNPIPTIDRELEKMLGDPKGPDRRYQDDWKPKERSYSRFEDCRGKSIAVPGSIGIIADYEGNEPNRRLLVDDGKRVWWIAEECTE